MPTAICLTHHSEEELEEGDGPIVLVLAPSKELVLQIHDVAVPCLEEHNVENA